MTKRCIVPMVTAVVVSLTVGVVAGFFLGVASTKAGRAFLDDLFEEEQKADISRPTTLIRDRFQLQYPTNWRIDVDDEDYDPDQMFSIDSPGSAFVMFVIGTVETEPEDNLQMQIRQFKKLMSSPAIDRFERYGRLTGKGATLKGKVMGIRTTTRLFAFSQDELTVMITQQCPDDDLNRAQDGLTLIESSFMFRTNTNQRTPNQPNAGDGK